MSGLDGACMLVFTRILLLTFKAHATWSLLAVTTNEASFEDSHILHGRESGCTVFGFSKIYGIFAFRCPPHYAILDTVLRDSVNRVFIQRY